jgi:MraZ protein
MMLIGTWRAHIEGELLALPQAFRPAVGEGLTVTRGFDRCLQAFPADSWQALACRVSNLPLTADAARSLRRMLFGAAVDLAVEPCGNLLIPRRLLAYAEISDQAVFVGCDSYFEIWSPQALRATSERPQTLERLAGLVAGLSSPTMSAVI